MSEIYQNAVDSLRIGMEYYLEQPSYSSRKHAILTLFHATELLLKERLYRFNPLFIYRKIDSKITEDSQTVSVQEALSRLRNLGLLIPIEQQRVIETIQRRRNRIEHHRYDHKDEDERIIAESLSFILLFADFELQEKLEKDIPPPMLRKIQEITINYDDLYWIVRHRLDRWMKEHWSDWDPAISDHPEEFIGTKECPHCDQEWLLIGHHPRPFCFHCNTSVDAEECEICGSSFLTGLPCCAPEEDEA